MERVDRYGIYIHFISTAITISSFPKNHSFLFPPTHQTLISHLLAITYNNEPMFNHSRKGPKFLDRNPDKISIHFCVHACSVHAGGKGTHVSGCMLVCVCEYAEGRGWHWHPCSTFSIREGSLGNSATHLFGHSGYPACSNHLLSPPSTSCLLGSQAGYQPGIPGYLPSSSYERWGSGL